MPGIGEHEKQRAYAMAKTVALRARDGGFVPEEASETVSEWFERWTDVRRAKGLRTVRNDVGRFGKWVAPIIGHKPMARVTRRDLEEVVQALDRAIRAEALRWKTAKNVWGVCTKMFADACRSKVLTLRVRDDNPARDVEGPDTGVERSGPYLFPSEFLALMQCERVPVRWKRIFMLTTYLYVRGSELEALECNSVNFAHGYVLVHQSVDSDTGEVKSTKTKDVRKVPIEPTLLPLLRKMVDEAAGEGRVVGTMPPQEEWAERLRKYLGWAGVTRADLFADDATRRPISFHDLRHTGITWRAVRGDEPLKVQRAAGHDDLRTTQKYINEAQTFEGASFGEPFPAVPPSLLSNYGSNYGFVAVDNSRPKPFSSVLTASPGGFEHGHNVRPKRRPSSRKHWNPGPPKWWQAPRGFGDGGRTATFPGRASKSAMY
jgi:integrase